MKIQLRLREFRQKKSLSQKELAQRLGVSRQSIIAIEGGQFLPSLPLILEMADFFQTSLEDICGWESPQFTSEPLEPPSITKANDLDIVNPINIVGKEVKTMREIMPFSPFREISSLHEAIDRIFDEAVASPTRLPVTISAPAINVSEDEKNVFVEAHVPGVKEDELEIEVGEDYLTIKGERKTEREEKKENYFRREFSYGSFGRTVSLPATVKSEKAAAHLEEGLLKIQIPKTEPKKPRARKIKVTAKK